MMLTVGERIILHLGQYSKYLDSFDVPLDISQDGIASALRISRAHAAIELKKLKDSGEVVERLSHIKRGKTKRKVYFLSQTGEDRAVKIKDFAQREGIEILPLLDLKKCRGADLWNSLENGNRDILAQASIFRQPFRREVLPITSISLLPVNQEGMVTLPQEIRSTIPLLISPQSIRHYHSFAADYWLGEGNYRERLYHLIQAKRTKEAEMLLGSKGSLLLESADDDLFQIVSSMRPTSPRYAPRIRTIQAEVAMRTKQYPRCKEILREMLLSDDQLERFEGMFISGLMAARQGDYRSALENLTRARETVPDDKRTRLETEIASALVASSRFDDARQMLEPLLSGGERDGENLERIFFLLGTVALRTGKAEESVRLFSKSRGAAKGKDSYEICSALSQAYAALGMLEKSREYSGKAMKRQGNSPEGKVTE